MRGAARTLGSRSFVRPFFFIDDRRGIVGSPKETILTTVNVAMIRLSGMGSVSFEFRSF